MIVIFVVVVVVVVVFVVVVSSTAVIIFPVSSFYYIPTTLKLYFPYFNLQESLAVDSNERVYETYLEETEVETDEEVEETVQKEVIKDVIKEVKIPQAKALYPFSGSGISVAKDEVYVAFDFVLVSTIPFSANCLCFFHRSCTF